MKWCREMELKLIGVCVIAGMVALAMVSLNYRAFRAYYHVPSALRIEPVVRYGRLLWGCSILIIFSGPLLPIFGGLIAVIAHGIRLRFRIAFQHAGESAFPLMAAALNGSMMALGAITVMIYIWTS